MRITAAQRRARAEHKALLEEIQSDVFLTEWMSESVGNQARFIAKTSDLPPAELEAMAARAGFRTWRQFLVCLEDKHRALCLFCTSPTFSNLWTRLRATDAKLDDFDMPLYGPHNRAVPATILHAIDIWHKQPKFTAAERVRHGKAVASACTKLLELLEPVTPGGVFDDFSDFTVSKAEAQSLFDSFSTPKAKRSVFGATENVYFSRQIASHYLKRAGFDPMRAVRGIKAAAELQRQLHVLPRKVKATTAYRTFMIRKVASAISGFGSRRKLAVGDQVIAEVVSLLINKDCSIDDARKALDGWRAEDSAFEFAEIIPRKK